MEVMMIWINEYLGAFDWDTVIHVVVRVVAAIICGGFIGSDREKAGKAAGLRSHILLCLGTTIFIMIPSINMMSDDALSRFAQGIGAFIGALALGTVLKKQESGEVIGLTTAMAIVPTAGIGMAIGGGYIWIAAICTVATWFVLRILILFEDKNPKSDQ